MIRKGMNQGDTEESVMDAQEPDTGNGDARGETTEEPEVRDEPTLEDRLRRLDGIVAELEGGEVELEKGLSLFEEGVRHIREAESLLARAELRVEELVGEGEGARTRPFREAAGE